MALQDDNNARTLKLYKALTSGKGLQGIVDIAAEVFDNPVLVADTSFKVLAHAEKPDTDNQLWLKIVNTGVYPSQYIHSFSKNDTLYNQVFSKNTPEVFSDDASPHRYLSKMVTLGGKPVGFATCIEYDRDLTENDAELFMDFCEIISTELRSNEHLTLGYGGNYEYFISEMINGPVKADFLEARLRQIELQVKSYNYILVAEYTDERTRRDHQIAYFGKELEQMIPNCYCIAYRNSLVALISRNNAQLFSSALSASIQKHLEMTEMLCGVSSCFRNIADMNIYYRQARETIRISRKLRLGNRLFEYAHMSFFHMIDIVGQTEELRLFCNPKLLDIIEYDENNHTKYAQSAYAYLKNNKNPTQTAEYLRIHRNTIDYRIK